MSPCWFLLTSLLFYCCMIKLPILSSYQTEFAAIQSSIWISNLTSSLNNEWRFPSSMFQQFLLWGFFAERRNLCCCWVPGCGGVKRAHDFRVSGMWMKKCEIIKGGAAQSHYHHVPSQSPTCFFGRKGADGHADTHFWGTHSYNSYLCFKTCLRLTRTVRTVWLSNSMVSRNIDDWHQSGTFLTPIHPHIVHIVGYIISPFVST